MTYNIRGALGMDRRRCLRRIAEVVSKVQPDLLALQEAHCRLPCSGFVDQPRCLARLTGLYSLFHPSFRLGFGSYGNVWLLRRGGARCARRRLTARGEPRAVLDLRLPAGIRAFGTHFGLHAKEKRAQALQLVGMLNGVSGPTIVAGDLNARPDSPEVAALLAAGLRHAVPPELPSFPADRPRARIDYLLASEHWAIERWEVVETLASDHLPLVVDLVLREGMTV